MVPLLHTRTKHQSVLAELMWHFANVSGFSKLGKIFLVVLCILFAEQFLAILIFFLVESHQGLDVVAAGHVSTK